MKIFVQIAAYRDDLLVSTVSDMLSKAKFPERCRVVICNQYNETDPFFRDLDCLRNDPRVEIIDIPCLESRGVCWARNLIQTQYRDEEFTLQIDAHMRFMTHWDEVLIGMIKQLQEAGSPKPLLSTYPPHFEPTSFKEKLAPPNQINFIGFNEEGLPDCWPDIIPDWEQLELPVPARFMAGGFSFTIGSFCKEVPHDPELYFWGEEINLAVRAFTNGYDLFHPHRNVIWHNYSRDTAPKHWNDVGRIHNITFYKLGRLFDNKDTDAKLNWGTYGLGTARTLGDYERYAGILLSEKKVQNFTLQCLPPSLPDVYDAEQAWEDSFNFVVRDTIRIPLKVCKAGHYTSGVIVFTSDGTRVHELILEKTQLQQFYTTEKDFEMQVSLLVKRLPDSWQLLFYFPRSGWQLVHKGHTSAFSRSLGGFFMNDCFVL